MKFDFKRYGDWLTGILFSVLTIVTATQIPKIKQTKISPVDSRFLPTVIVIGMAVLSVVQLYNAYKKWKALKASEAEAAEKAPAETEEELAKEKEEAPDYKRVGLTLLSSLVYVVLLKPVGFVISSIAYLEAQMCVMAPPEDRKPLRFLVISVVSTAVIYVVFYYGLSLMLPTGILTGIL